MDNDISRWLTIESIIKFASPYHFLIVILPSTVGICSIIEFLINLSKTKLVAVGTIVLIFLFLSQIYSYYKEYEKSMAEVLETGYFYNFFDKIVQHIWDRKYNNIPLKIKFNNGQKEVIETIKTSQLKFIVILPLSYDDFLDTINIINKTTKIGSLDNIYKIRFSKNPDDTITVYECPQTLMAIPKHGNHKIKYDEKTSKLFHKHFNAYFDEDWRNASDKISSEIFIKKSSLNNDY
ncbi:hypothetical protein FXW07_08600 [Methanosarcina sp. DH1]|uniref:STING domain-containing protein n=1 Tax=Methanosarcina sp. DH1 TaxID=2605695 RepID=UPI001E2856C3|nr:STING domain-containing protein [Methanosarcina sp. DH1]MCC4766668.1 hypothetical protein [Methanosarcina sp. DH1]